MSYFRYFESAHQTSLILFTTFDPVRPCTLLLAFNIGCPGEKRKLGGGGARTLITQWPGVLSIFPSTHTPHARIGLCIGNRAQQKAALVGKIDNSFTPASRPPPLYCFIFRFLFFYGRNHHGWNSPLFAYCGARQIWKIDSLRRRIYNRATESWW